MDTSRTTQKKTSHKPGEAESPFLTKENLDKYGMQKQQFLKTLNIYNTPMSQHIYNT